MKIDSTLVLLKTDFSTGKVGGRRMHWSEKIAKDIIKRSPDKESTFVQRVSAHPDPFTLVISEI